ncbi:MAG: GNAT family protein [Candidatus Thermoplasmatota archaeon]|nr:GNAT family protein [Candidatus Thermoplasmatota archaeon]
MKKSLLMRPMGVEDVEILLRWFTDADNVRFLSPVIRCRTHTRESIEMSILNSDPGFERLFMFHEKDSGTIIGHGGIDGINHDDERAELFCIVGEQNKKGKGYGTEMVTHLLEYAFGELGLNSIMATATVTNIPSIAAMERNGFQRIGVARQYHKLDGKYYDEAFFDITREDYERMKKI